MMIDSELFKELFWENYPDEELNMFFVFLSHIRALIPIMRLLKNNEEPTHACKVLKSAVNPYKF